MKNKLNHIFNNIAEIEPPKHLGEDVLRKIYFAQQQKIRQKKMFFNFAFVMSSVLFVVCLFIFGNQLVSSDFWSIMSLSFSDFGSVVSNWQEFFWSLLETFPAEQLASLIAPVFLLLILIKKYSINTLSFRSASWRRGIS